MDHGSGWLRNMVSVAPALRPWTSATLEMLTKHAARYRRRRLLLSRNVRPLNNKRARNFSLPNIVLSIVAIPETNTGISFILTQRHGATIIKAPHSQPPGVLRRAAVPGLDPRPVNKLTLLILRALHHDNSSLAYHPRKNLALCFEIYRS